MKNLILFLSIIMLMSSCVSKKKYRDALRKREEVNVYLDKIKTQQQDCEKLKASLTTDLKKKIDEVEVEKSKNKALQDQIELMKNTNNNLLDRMADLSIVSKTGAESIKKSLETLDNQSKYINDLNSSMARKDSLNMALVLNLKRSLSDINDQDVSIEVKKGVVYISLSDKMLFQSGSYEIQPSAQLVLGKIASVINDHRELDVLVEGHTDNVPISTGCIKDNWDLSAMRSTTIVRTLQTKYGVAPSRLTAGGRGEYVPKSSNDNMDGRSLNRRTEIIILPKLDQFFQLLEKK